MPMATIMARRDTRLKVNPARLKRMGVAASAMGMAKMTERAVFSLPRNSRQMMATTRAVRKSSW